MFENARSFYQNINRWNLVAVEFTDDMFVNSGLINNDGTFIDINMIPERFVDDDDYEEEEGEGVERGGIAFEIHDAFNKINLKRYIETIFRYLRSLDEETPFYKDRMWLPTSTYEERLTIVDKIKSESETVFNEHIKDFEEPEKTNKQNAFRWVIQKFSQGEGRINDKKTMTIVSLTFAYVWSSQWTDDERGEYIYTWITDNAEAYSSNRSAAFNVSCTAGIFERVVLSLTVILAKEDINETQQTILNIINDVLPDMGEIFKLWVINTDNDENIKTLIANAKTEENVFAFAISEDDTKTLRDSFTEFAKNIYEEHGKTLITDDDIFKEYIENIGEYIQYGGRRYHKLKKTKLTRKTKTVKQNKKQKRKTQKKNKTQKRKTQKRKNK